MTFRYIVISGNFGFRLLKEFELIDWMKGRLLPQTGEDDLILEIVVFIGTCATDSSAAMYLCQSDILPSLIDLLKAKQEDDEIVLQVTQNSLIRLYPSVLS